MGRILEDSEVVEIRVAFALNGSRSYSDCPVPLMDVRVPVLASKYDVSTATIRNILEGRSYRRPSCYPVGSQGKADAEQRDRDWEAEQKRRRKMRYVSATKRSEVLERDNFRCVYCGCDLRAEPLAIDHRVPVSAGGTNVLSNLQATCKTCNARKKNYNGSDDRLREYLDRRRGIDQITDKVNAVLSPIVGSLIWGDSDAVSCPWCGEAVNRVKEKVYGREDKLITYDVELNHAFVWGCKPCRRYFSVDTWTAGNFGGLSGFASSLNDHIWGRWYALDEEVGEIVLAIRNDADLKDVRELVGAYAGDIIELKRRQHTHSRNGNYSNGATECWCEYGECGFRLTGMSYKQIELMANTNE